jgi:hypothetical protein
MFMQPMMSGNRATMSLLLIVMFATIFLRATFLTEWFLSFFPPLFSSRRSSATLPCCLMRELLYVYEAEAVGGRYARYILDGLGRCPGSCSRWEDGGDATRGSVGVRGVGSLRKSSGHRRERQCKSCHKKELPVAKRQAAPRDGEVNVSAKAKAQSKRAQEQVDE